MAPNFLIDWPFCSCCVISREKIKLNWLFWYLSKISWKNVITLLIFYIGGKKGGGGGGGSYGAPAQNSGYGAPKPSYGSGGGQGGGGGGLFNGLPGLGGKKLW